MKLKFKVIHLQLNTIKKVYTNLDTLNIRIYVQLDSNILINMILNTKIYR